MRRGFAIAAAAIGVCAGLFALLPLAATVSSPPTQFPGAPAHEVERVAFSPSLALRLATTPPAAVVMEPHRLLSSETDQLDAFVRSGGVLWIVGEDLASMGDLTQGITVLPGTIHAKNGSDPLVAEAGREFTQGSLLSLDATSDWRPLVTAGVWAFRDTNGNGVLEAGEPAGPLVSGVVRDLGKGRTIAIALAKDPTDSASFLLSPLTFDLPAGAIWWDAPRSSSSTLEAARGFDRTASVAGLRWQAGALLVLATVLLLFFGSRNQAALPEEPPRAGPATWLHDLRRLDPSRAPDLLDDDPGSDGL